MSDSTSSAGFKRLRRSGGAAAAGAGEAGSSDEERSEPRSRRRLDESDDESGEDLFGDNMQDDYREMNVLDTYDASQLDERNYAPMDYDARLAAEEDMVDRDRREGRGQRPRIAVALTSDDEDVDESEGGFRARQRRRHMMADAVDEEPEEVPEEPFNLESFEGALRTWIDQPQTRVEVKRRLRNFLETYTTMNGERVHDKVIDEMCAANSASLHVSYLHLSHHSPILAIWLADVPKQMLQLFDAVAQEVVLSRYRDYHMIADEIHVRIMQMPILDSLRDLRHAHLNALVKVSGVVTRRSAVHPQLRVVHYNCIKCGFTVGPIYHTDDRETNVGPCPSCLSPGPFSINQSQTIYRNYQKIVLQESPGTVPPGRVPRYKDVILVADLIDCARPGEEVEVTGVYTHTFDANLNTRQGFPVFATVLEANYVETKNDVMAAIQISEEDKLEIAKLSKDPKIVSRIVHSIAPSIYGHDHAKMALALAMFGGREKNVNQKHRIRGDINVLMLGDPGVAKSQFLKYIEKTAPRAVYTTGKGASAVGLTAAVHKDPHTGEWALEGGALVLADRGVCLIDEFDKMNDADRTSIHEAMEQQSISISKAGIVTTLQARCAVLAAANPIGGRYDLGKTFSENVQLTDPILTRFDILCVMRDEVDAILDERLAAFVVDSHSKAHPAAQEAAREAVAAGATEAQVEEALLREAGPQLSKADAQEVKYIPQSLLKKYILTAKALKPQLTGIDQDKVARLYADLRKESEISGGIPIAVRHIESIMRMSEAAARMRLSAVVSNHDVDLAIRVMLESFITAQKFSVMRSLRRHFSRYLDTGADYNHLLLVKLRDMVRERQALEFVRAGRYAHDAEDVERVEFKVPDLLERARKHGIDDGTVYAFLGSDVFLHAGFSYDPERRLISRSM